MNRRAFALCFLAGLLSGAQAAAQLPPAVDAVWQEIRKDYLADMRSHAMVGSSLMLVHEGRVADHVLHGFADLKPKRRVDADTIYHWGSITKTLTALAVMQLRDRGKLGLDDPIVKYLPELRKVHAPKGDVEAVTLRHLLGHAAGFRGPTWPWGGNESWHPHEPTEWAQIVAMLPYTKLSFKPGSRFSYSNPAYIFLGRVIELLTGDDYEVHVDKNILKPLGMHRTYFDNTPYHLLKHRSNCFSVTDGDAAAHGLDFDTGITVSNSGLNAPLTDMAKFLAFLAGDPARNDVHEQVLKRSSLGEMWQPLHTIGSDGRLKRSMGLGFFLYDIDGTKCVGHTGSQKAFVAFFLVHPGSRSACIAAFNSVGRPQPNTRALSLALQRKLLDKVFPSLAK